MSFNSSLVIEKPGSYIKRSGNRFIVQNNGQRKEYSADKISQLLFSSPAAISTEAVCLTIDKNIDIVYLDWKGNCRTS